MDVMDANHCEVYPRQVPDVESFVDKAQAAGVNNSSYVIVYSDTDAHGFLVSGRGWWTFKVTGHFLKLFM